MTESQLKARRENAQFSTGPRTAAGRKRSSLNAFRHGLTGQIIVHATPEDREAFNKHCDGIREALAPVGALETDLAQAIAGGRWRLNRASALENAIFALGQTEDPPEDSSRPELDAALAQARTWLAHSHELQLLALYESRISRSVEKNMAQLRALQDERKPAAEAPPQRGIILRFEGPDDDPAADPAPENPDSSVRSFKSGDPASNQPDPASLPEPDTRPSRPRPSRPQPSRPQPSREDPPQRTAQRPDRRNNRPEPTRPPTMDDEYDDVPGDKWARNPIGQIVPRR